MDEARAKAIVDQVRRFADFLLAELRGLEEQLSPAEVQIWRTNFGKALGALHDRVLIPIERVHPDVIPKSMGGRGPERPIGPE